MRTFTQTISMLAIAGAIATGSATLTITAAYAESATTLDCPEDCALRDVGHYPYKSTCTAVGLALSLEESWKPGSWFCEKTNFVSGRPWTLWHAYEVPSGSSASRTAAK